MIARPPRLRSPWVVALDPGTRHLGLACYQLAAGRWVLRAATSITTTTGGVVEAVEAVWLWCNALGIPTEDRRALVAEVPRSYPGQHAQEADLGRLRAVVGRVASAWEWGGGDAVHRVVPSAWKGQVPKDIAHTRYGAQLTPTERVTVDWTALGPDGRDAVGLGLWATGRYPQHAGHGGPRATERT